MKESDNSRLPKPLRRSPPFRFTGPHGGSDEAPPSLPSAGIRAAARSSATHPATSGRRETTVNGAALIQRFPKSPPLSCVLGSETLSSSSSSVPAGVDFQSDETWFDLCCEKDSRRVSKAKKWQKRQHRRRWSISGQVAATNGSVNESQPKFYKETEPTKFWASPANNDSELIPTVDPVADNRKDSNFEAPSLSENPIGSLEPPATSEQPTAASGLISIVDEPAKSERIESASLGLEFSDHVSVLIWVDTFRETIPEVRYDYFLGIASCKAETNLFSDHMSLAKNELGIRLLLYDFGDPHVSELIGLRTVDMLCDRLIVKSDCVGWSEMELRLLSYDVCKKCVSEFILWPGYCVNSLCLVNTEVCRVAYECFKLSEF